MMKSRELKHHLKLILDKSPGNGMMESTSRHTLQGHTGRVNKEPSGTEREPTRLLDNLKG